MDERNKERMREALLRGDREAVRDVIATEQEHAPENAYDFAMVAGYAVMRMAFGDLDEERLQAAMGTMTPTAILREAGLGPIESRPFAPVEQARRVAAVYVRLYNDGLPEDQRLEVERLRDG